MESRPFSRPRSGSWPRLRPVLIGLCAALHCLDVDLVASTARAETPSQPRQPASAKSRRSAAPAVLQPHRSGGAVHARPIADEFGPVLEPPLGGASTGPDLISPATPVDALTVPPGGASTLSLPGGSGRLLQGDEYLIISSRGCPTGTARSERIDCLTYYRRENLQSVPVDISAADFQASLCATRPICFVIHGSYNYWKDVLHESESMHRWLKSACPAEPIQMVYYTWPGDGYVPVLLPVEIAILGRRSSLHGVYLAELIRQLPPNSRVSLIGHSHGARTVLSAMHLLSGGRIENDNALSQGTLPGMPVISRGQDLSLQTARLEPQPRTGTLPPPTLGFDADSPSVPTRRAEVGQRSAKANGVSSGRTVATSDPRQSPSPAIAPRGAIIRPVQQGWGPGNTAPTAVPPVSSPTPAMSFDPAASSTVGIGPGTVPVGTSNSLANVRIRAVFLAAAVDHDWLNPDEQYGRAIGSLERLLVYRNSRDFWLGVYPLKEPFGKPALSQFGLSPRDRAMLGMSGQKVYELDVASLVGTGHALNHYYEVPELAQPLAPFVQFQDDMTGSLAPGLTPQPAWSAGRPIDPTLTVSPGATTPPGPGSLPTPSFGSAPLNPSISTPGPVYTQPAPYPGSQSVGFGPRWPLGRALFPWSSPALPTSAPLSPGETIIPGPSPLPPAQSPTPPPSSGAVPFTGNGVAPGQPRRANSAPAGTPSGGPPLIAPGGIVTPGAPAVRPSGPAVPDLSPSQSGRQNTIFLPRAPLPPNGAETVPRPPTKARTGS